MTESHHHQLNAFAQRQLSTLSPRQICASSVHQILTTAFFTGAAIGLAKPLKAPKATYLASLRALLQERLGLNDASATGMIESNTRLYQRYWLIHKLYIAGLHAAQHWQAETSTEGPSLKDLLYQYRHLSMSELNIEGIKPPKPAPSTVDAPAAPPPPPAPMPPPARRSRRVLGLLLVLVLLATGLLIMKYQPAALRDILPRTIHDFFPSASHSPSPQPNHNPLIR